MSDLEKISSLNSDKVSKLKSRLAIYQSAFSQSVEANMIFGCEEKSPDSNTLIVLVNTALLNLTGYTENELLAENPSIILGDFANEKIKGSLDAISIGEKNSISDLIFLKKNGSPYDSRISWSVLKDQSGASKYILVHIIDTTDDKKSQHMVSKRLRFEVGVSATTQTLMQSNPSLEILASAMRDFLFFTELDCVYLLEVSQETNKSSHYKLIFEEKKDESYLGYTSLNLTEDWDTLKLERWNQMLRSGNVLAGMPENFRKTEQWFFKRDISYILCYPIFTVNGFYGALVWERKKSEPFDVEELLMYQTTAYWVSNFLERIEVYEELQMHKERLEDLVEIRTHDLKLAMIKAESANKLKSEFLTNMSHELRTPLNSIIGFSQLIELGPSDLKGAKYLNYINTSGIRLLKMINELLELSKLEAGKIASESTSFLPSELINECISLLTPQAKQKQITIRTALEDITIKLHSDVTKVRQILVNLISNAIKFSPDLSDVEIISTSDTQWYIISVIDHGEGIAVDDQAQLFTNFTRFSKNTASEGTGLGLVISKKFAEVIGAKIDFESKTGEGSKFSLSIPLQ